MPEKINDIRNNLYNTFIYNNNTRKPSLDTGLREELIQRFMSQVNKLNKLLHVYEFFNKETNLITFWEYDKV